MTSNPALSAKKIPIPKRKRYVETAELDAIADAGSPVIRAVIDLAYVTGQRISDVLDLGVGGEDKEYVRLVQMKTQHRMKLRRTPGLVAVIKKATAICTKQLRKSAREKGVDPETIVFNSFGRPYTYFGFNTLWQRAKTTSGVQDTRFHDVRATALTDADELGMDAQKLAGHASRTTTEGTQDSERSGAARTRTVSERTVTVSQRNRRSDTNRLMAGYVMDFMSFVCCICSSSIAYRPEIKSVISLGTGSDKMHLVSGRSVFCAVRKTRPASDNVGKKAANWRL